MLEDKIKELSNLKSKMVKNIENTHLDMEKIALESLRVSNLCSNTENIIKDISDEFEKKTGLNKQDFLFVLLFSAIQIGRWTFFPAKKTNLDSEASDKIVDKWINKPLKKVIQKPEYMEILFKGVPYDASYSGYKYSHRHDTLGHDAILGLFFGPINILTKTLTKSNLILETYTVTNGKTDELILFPEAYKCAENFSKEDPKVLYCAILKQIIHTGSDIFTKIGLPIPILNLVTPDVSIELYKNNINISQVGKQSAQCYLINQIAAIIHGFFYDASKYPERKYYDIKTRKIVIYSNLISMSTNIIYTAISKEINKLDIGGITIGIINLLKNNSFIETAKREFIKNEFYKEVYNEDFYSSHNV